MSWRGWLLVTSAGLVAAYLAFLNIHPFLAVTHRVNTNILVVEGSIQRDAIGGDAEEFKNGSYEQIFTTGGPKNGNGGYVNDYYTSASVAAEGLEKFGIPADLVQMVPLRVIAGERTYSSAVALRDWFREHNTPVHSSNVLTEGPHARGTQLLYEAFWEKRYYRYHANQPGNWFGPPHRNRAPSTVTRRIRTNSKMTWKHTNTCKSWRSDSSRRNGVSSGTTALPGLQRRVPRLLKDRSLFQSTLLRKTRIVCVRSMISRTRRGNNLLQSVRAGHKASP